MSSNFDVIAGHPESRVILHVPHSSTHIPTALISSFALSETELQAEAALMADLNTDLLAELAASMTERFGSKRPWMFINRLSRLVVDPERFPDDSEEMNQVGMGAVYAKTSTGSELRPMGFSSAESQQLLNDYFQPYAAAFEKLVAERLNICREVTIIDFHSYAAEALPYELHGEGERPNLCIGVDEFHTRPDLMVKIEQAFAAIGTIAQNTPFAGTYVPLSRYKTDASVQSAMLELRKDSYDFERPDSVRFQSVASMLANLLARIDKPRSP